MPDLPDLRGRLWPRSDPRPVRLAERRLPRPTAQALAAIEHRTVVRVANVQAEGLVQTEKVREVDRLTREAATGDVFLNEWLGTLARGDLLTLDRLRFYAELARVGKGEILADTIDSYCRESRS